MFQLERIFSRRLTQILRRTGAVVLGLACTGAFADSSVWVASAGDSKIYLGGTVHLLRPGDYPLPEEYEQAYKDSNRLFFETDVASMNDMGVQARMLQRLTYDDERTLQTVLSKEAYQALSDHLLSVGMPIMMMEKFKPGLVVSTLQLLEFQKMGFTPQGVDMYFSNRAMGDAKAVGELESVDAQIDYIANMGEGNESEFILLSLDDLEEISTSMDDLVSAWRDGDMDALAELFVDDMRLESEELYDSLLLERNLNWLPVIEQMFQEDGNEFVLVGAAHLVGKDGLLNLLQAKGYQVKQL
ncbi:MAG: TraB/GumN family protein [Gammaproteobacteria bacterium]|nr:TraB/GumN family protein [Pseudomonadales bacterium]MCP5347558.1 TraB/GumN family protein [Pseudomonadales bacterium]